MAIKELKINKFDGGLTENLRNTSSNKEYYTENVILDSDLVSQTANCAVQNTGSYNKEYSVIKLLDSYGALYGYGQENVTSKDTTIYYKAYGATSNWAPVTNGTIAGTVMRLYDPFFVTYGGDIYLDGGNNYICKYSGTTMTNNWLSFNGGMSGGIVWQGNMYGYQNQDIYKITTAPAATKMISIPSGQTIVNMVVYGNYLAIVCTSSSSGISKMYLWDGITTTTFTEIVEIGIGDVAGGTILDGVIYVPISLGNRRGFTILAYSSGRFVAVYSYTGRYNRAGTYNYTFVGSKPKTASGHIYFLVIGTRSDSTYANIYEAQVFRYGKTNPEYSTSLSCWKTLNSTPLSGGDNPQSLGNDILIYETAIGQKQPQMLAAVLYGMEGGYSSYYYEMTTTFNALEGTSSASAVIETPVFNDGNPNQKKNLKAVSLFYGNLATGTAVLKYKKDNETTWTTIFTNGNETTTNHTTNVIESSGANLPQFNEIQYRIELSGNASLTGYKMKYETLTEENY